jgi:glycosyltransferase involved in cell wall biosynthesis
LAEVTRKARILHVIDNTDPGGAQTQLAAIFDGLRDQYEFSVAVLGRAGRAEEKYRSLGIRVHALQTGSSRWNPGALPPLLQLIRREEPDLVHAHLFKSMVLTTLAARLAGIPCLLHDHSGLDAETLRFYFPNRISRNLYSWVYRLALRSCAGVLVLTPQIKDSYPKDFQLPAEKITVLPNAIDFKGIQTVTAGGLSLREELDLPADTRLIMMVGRLAPEKNWPTFIEIASRFPDPSQNAFIAVGTGSLEGQLRKSVWEKGVKNVHFLGDTQDVPSILHQADVFILTSQREAFGIVLLEAMAAGLPVIATCTSGPSSIIQPEINGLLVEPDDVDGFMAALQRVLTDPELASRLVQNAYQSLPRFDSKVICQQLSDLYNSVTHSRRTRSHD